MIKWRAIQYFFKYSIDATDCTGYGKMVNDSPSGKANALMKRELWEGSIHLCLYAKADIKEGSEIRFENISSVYFA